jgi:hypothetical protein
MKILKKLNLIIFSFLFFGLNLNAINFVPNKFSNICLGISALSAIVYYQAPSRQKRCITDDEGYQSCSLTKNKMKQNYLSACLMSGALGIILMLKK